MLKQYKILNLFCVLPQAAADEADKKEDKKEEDKAAE